LRFFFNVRAEGEVLLVRSGEPIHSLHRIQEVAVTRLNSTTSGFPLPSKLSKTTQIQVTMMVQESLMKSHTVNRFRVLFRGILGHQGIKHTLLNVQGLLRR
jgi:hypothetical protein